MTETAVVPREDQTGIKIRVDNIAGRDDVERIETHVQVPAAFQYVIPGRKKIGQNQYVDDNKVGLTSDGYDYLNRFVGVSFYLPERVPDQDGTMASNPIHRPDYIYMRMGGVWYNETGALVGLVEDLEVDYQLVYQNARLEAYESEVLLDADKQPVFDASGNPKIILKNAGDEKKALKALNQLRTMGMRYAQTVLRTRILKVATGIKQLPIPEGQPRPFTLRVVGYRDKMTILERQETAQAAIGQLYGRPPELEPISTEELRDIEADDADDAVASVVNEAVAVVADMTDAEKYEALQQEWREAGT